MPSPEPRATPPGPQTAANVRRRPVPPGGERRRPEPTSSLAPSPSPLMSVPDGGPAGRRQHHRPGTPRQEQVYLSGRVPRALRDELHIRAIAEGRPVVDLLRDAIRHYLDEA
ncbi:hypothetical protein [Actinomycetospora atypica]|uniref:Ribbon-helix-helix protein CopG domain-containing protein n=1 Tax=Actinomycetospora atypica TaxID=1290095 RepID=A0ABV9YR86_9PSEU